MSPTGVHMDQRGWIEIVKGSGGIMSCICWVQSVLDGRLNSWGFERGWMGKRLGNNESQVHMKVIKYVLLCSYVIII